MEDPLRCRYSSSSPPVFLLFCEISGIHCNTCINNFEEPSDKLYQGSFNGDFYKIKDKSVHSRDL